MEDGKAALPGAAVAPEQQQPPKPGDASNSNGASTTTPAQPQVSGSGSAPTGASVPAAAASRPVKATPPASATGTAAATSVTTAATAAPSPTTVDAVNKEEVMPNKEGAAPASAAKVEADRDDPPNPNRPGALVGSDRPPLNVKDALSYLDSVKAKFSDTPGIYNSFLDIMKDFKTTVIDTPGVIDRVSSLFRFHPMLISNFNLFLPDGYRLDCNPDPNDPNKVLSIFVITPNGTQRLPAGRSSNLTNIDLPGMVEPTNLTRTITSLPPAYNKVQLARVEKSKQEAKAKTTENGPVAAVTSAAAATSAVPTPKAAPTTAGQAKQESQTAQLPATKTQQAPPSPPPQRQGMHPSAPRPSDQAGQAKPAAATSTSTKPAPAPAPVPASAAVVPSTASAQPSRTATPAAASALTGERRPAIEFNHAISYVNKIKNRFIKDPEIYKTFLDILQTYQKEQKPIQDVYAQVTKLFKTAPDLLDEFKQFLPDHSQQGQQAAAAEAAAAEKKKQQAQQQAYPAAVAAGQAVSRARARPAGPPSIASDDVVAQTSAPPAKRKRAPVQEKAPVVPQPEPPKQKAGKSRGKTTAGVKDPPTIAQQSNARYDTIPGQSAAGPGYPQPILSYLPPGYSLPGTGPGATGQIPAPIAQETPEEKAFFDRIADFIDDKFTYYEFLKLLNLYTQDIIDLPTLVSRAWMFIGSAPDLWLDFREVVGWRDGQNVNGRVIENGEWIVENVPVIDKREKLSDLTRCEAAGPSYRRLPKQEMNMTCSGRDSLCWEVLNDEWVSVANLGTEEVFLASRKNPFEEALHRSEEERHEYDFHIEANLRTITLLEPIAARIALMEPEERITFRLKPGLGNQSKSIYQRIIKKVYGKDMGREVIQALHENPCVSVPIVLARLKQKDEEWKRALREWNRVWREVDAKNFYRSLDHQGITFKAQDKRYIASKSMVSEIETMRRTELQRQISAPPHYRPPPPTYQIAYPISDENVLFDSLKLFLSYLDRAPGYHTMAERDRIEAFLRSLTSLVFAIPVSVLDSMLTPMQDDTRSMTASDDEDGMSDSAASSIMDGPVHSNGGGRGRNQTPLSQYQSTAAKKAADLRKKAMKNATTDSGKKAPRIDDEATPMTSRDSTPVPQLPPVLATAEQTSLAQVGRDDTPMADADVQPTSMSDAQNMLEQQQNGESTFKVDVPTSAAGLDGMAGVETIQTSLPSQDAMQTDIPVPTEPVQPAQSLADASPVISTPSTQVPTSDHVQTASETMENGPAASTSSVPTAEQTDPSSSNPVSPPIPALQNAQPRGEPQIRRFNFFCNTPYYCAIRLLHLLYSRLYVMKEAARNLGSAASKDALTNSAFTAYGKANPRCPNHDPTAPALLYDNMLELCEKLFGSEIDQSGFEDGIRGLFGNKGYQIFTIDKLLSALVKTVWSLIDSNREAYSANGDIFKLLVDDRRYPTTAQAQQISYRINSELAAGSEENLYRVEWMPRRHLLTFQLLGKDEVLPEDEADLSKIWERYIESFINDEVTAGLAVGVDDIAKNAYLKKNLEAARAKREILPQLFARSELESRVCMRSYRIFWQKKSEDTMHRAWSQLEPSKLESLAAKRKARFGKWLEQAEKSWSTKDASRPNTATKEATPAPSAEVKAVPAESQEKKDEEVKPVVAVKAPAQASDKPVEASVGPVVEAPKQDKDGDTSMQG